MKDTPPDPDDKTKVTSESPSAGLPDLLGQILEDYHFGLTHHGAIKYNAKDELENQRRIKECQKQRKKLKAQITALIEGIIGEDIEKTKEVEGSPVAMYYVNKRLAKQRKKLKEVM